MTPIIYFNLREATNKRGVELELAGDEVAMAYVWRTSDKFTYEDVIDTATAKKLQLLIVEKFKDSKNASTLFMVGVIVAKGKIVQRDVTQANSLFVKAWRVGEREAAQKLVELNLDVHDTATAYLWYLRCMDACNNSAAQRTNSFFEKDLTKDQILQVQAAAADKSVDTIRLQVTRGTGRDGESDAMKKWLVVKEVEKREKSRVKIKNVQLLEPSLACVTTQSGVVTVRFSFVDPITNCPSQEEAQCRDEVFNNPMGFQVLSYNGASR